MKQDTHGMEVPGLPLTIQALSARTATGYSAALPILSQVWTLLKNNQCLLTSATGTELSGTADVMIRAVPPISGIFSSLSSRNKKLEL